MQLVGEQQSFLEITANLLFAGFKAAAKLNWNLLSRCLVYYADCNLLDSVSCTVLWLVVDGETIFWLRGWHGKHGSVSECVTIVAPASAPTDASNWTKCYYIHTIAISSVAISHTGSKKTIRLTPSTVTHFYILYLIPVIPLNKNTHMFYYLSLFIYLFLILK